MKTGERSEAVFIINAAATNFSPQHPPTHGASRSPRSLNGEIIQRITPEIGLSHRGTEKSIDRNSYPSPLPHPDRSDHVPTITQESSRMNALERLIGCVGYIYPSTRRTLSLESYRIPNHRSAITTHAIDTGSLLSYRLLVSQKRSWWGGVNR